MKSVSYTEARDRLKDLIDQVNEDHVPVRIRRRNGEAAMMLAEADFAGLQEILYLLGNPANAQRLLDARRRTHREALSRDEVERELGL